MPWVNFAEIRQKVSLGEVLFELYHIKNLKREGNKAIGPCPVHGGDSPRAFHADLDKNIWHCFSKCQKGGNQLDFVAAKEGIAIREAALMLQGHFLEKRTTGAAASPEPPRVSASVDSRTSVEDRTATKIPDEKPTVKERNPPINLALSLAPGHPHLLEERGLKPETIEHFGVGYCGRGILRGTIAIPVHDENGQLVAYAGRALKSLKPSRNTANTVSRKGFRKELVLYSFHRAKTAMAAEGLILVEGFFTVMKLVEAGFPSVVACMGSQLSDCQAELAVEAKEVVILFDGDEPGWKGAEAAREKLTDRTVVRLVRLPAGSKPDTLPLRPLRWALNGVRALDLSSLTFSFRDSK